jgi:hypothetical protein
VFFPGKFFKLSETFSKRGEIFFKVEVQKLKKNLANDFWRHLPQEKVVRRLCWAPSE